MYSGWLGDSISVIFCNYVVDLFCLNYFVMVFGNRIMLEVKIGGIILVMLIFSGKWVFCVVKIWWFCWCFV